MIKIARTELFAGQIGGEGGGLLRISSDRDNQRILAGGGGGLKFSISGFFVAGKFWQVCFFYLSRDFFGYSKTNILYFPCYII